MVDGPSPEHELVIQGRLEGQAPEIDPVVYLTDCDPTALGPGDLISARIVGARGYDLLAAPESEVRSRFSESPRVEEPALPKIEI
jgi:ribosomal protein S12 methylthiotransferase